MHGRGQKSAGNQATEQQLCGHHYALSRRLERRLRVKKTGEKIQKILEYCERDHQSRIHILPTAKFFS
jgi:hypothetical protein